MDNGMDDTGMDDTVIELRSAGRSYGAIARQLDLGSARRAFDAFHRALRRQPPEIQARLRDQELHRLDSLAYHYENDSRISTTDLKNKLTVIDRLRASLVTP